VFLYLELLLFAMTDALRNAAENPEERTTAYWMALLSLLGFGYIFCSTSLIAFNKYLINVDRFPCAICLVFIQMIFCSVFAGFLYLVKPSLFPSLSDPAKLVAIDSSLVLKRALPIAVLFAGQLVLSNTAYLHSSVAFLQMMKESHLALVYTFSLFAALERFSWRSVGIIFFIIFGLTLTIQGEVNFSMTGFILQGLSSLFECSRIVLSAMLLSNAGQKLDALTYVMLVMPLCALILGVGICALTAFPQSQFMTPSWVQLVQWWPHLFANACVAFLLNVVIALFVKYSSAVAFILSGIVKDTMIVMASALVFRELISLVQVVGFFLQLVGILVWSLIKTFPDRFDAGLAAGFSSFIIRDEAVKGAVLLGKGKYGSTCEDGMTGDIRDAKSA